MTTKPQLFKNGQKVWVHSGDATLEQFGSSTQREKMIETIQTINNDPPLYVGFSRRELLSLGKAVFLDGYVWMVEDLRHISPQWIKKIEAVEKDVNKINAVIPIATKWLMGADKLSNNKVSGYKNTYSVYKASSEASYSDEYALIDEGCFGKLTSLIRQCQLRKDSSPNRILYKPNFKNEYIPDEKHLNSEEIQRWVVLCKKHGMLPKYINSHIFLDGRVIIKIDKKLCYDKLFFYLVNARYCDERPDILKMIIYFTDIVGLNFYVSYVLAHFIAENYDEEHCALPHIRHRKEVIKTWDEKYGEYYTCIIYHRPRPRDVIMWSMGLYAFVNEWSGTKPIIEYNYPEGCPWRLQRNIRKLTPKQWEFSLEVNNKTYNILKGFDPKTTKWRKK